MDLAMQLGGSFTIGRIGCALRRALSAGPLRLPSLMNIRHVIMKLNVAQSPRAVLLHSPRPPCFHHTIDLTNDHSTNYSTDPTNDHTNAVVMTLSK
ncbi:uncharacterized protein MYCGRDRAFT_106662 [Zymoseptoria tritici IPO323]|uniref:Uncharacterized protein n=1 Tax=Zymoseptoria tritici (strain CBS 115943 / IPO323) TaxID=336722 RepID=F9XRP8_ZYMTI|nr:uncharacterized protein MYCGRDRAFT_106662 [Zymoseptoria tritici IPO323]EGP82073.1 hypothetical protein MYCGRDRAFT_106662 [Zymoseptoria tritici IPO323]